MLKPVSAIDLDNAQYELKCAVDLVGAVHSAMVCGDSEPKSYFDALYGAYCHLYDLVKGLKGLYETEE